MNKQYLFSACLSVVLFHASMATNIVVTDTGLTTGSSAITTPSIGGNAGISATNSTSMSTLVGLDGFASIQNYSGFGSENLNISNAYIFAFTDSSRPDIQITFTGSVPSSGVYINNGSFQSSVGGSFRVAADTAGSATYRIDLGAYDGGIFTTGAGVEALGFTLTGRYTATDANGGATITYYDASDSILSTQVLDSAADCSGYTGFQSTGNPISYVEISFTGDVSAAPLWGLDDLGTTAIPEGSTFALWASVVVGALAILYRRIYMKND